MFFIGLLVCILLILLLYRYKGRGSVKFFLAALTIKLSAGLFIGYLYSNYYPMGGDTFSFFESSLQWSKVARERPFEYLQSLLGFEQFKFNLQELSYGRYDRALPLIKLLSVFNLITGDNYWLGACLFSLISFAASWFLYVNTINHFVLNKLAVWLALFAWPSSALWTSGLTKDSLAFACLSLLFAFMLRLYFSKRTGPGLVLLSIIALWILWLLKYYYAALFVVFFFPLIGVVKIGTIKRWSLQKQNIVYMIFIVVLPLGLSMLHPNLFFNRLPLVIHENYHAFILLSSESGAMHYPSLQPNWTSVFLNSPKALMTGLFMPLLPEAGNGLRWLVLIENYLFIIFMLSAFVSISKLFKHEHALLMFSLLGYALVLATFLALSSPNYGTLLRFKIGFMPFLLILVLTASPLFSKFSKYIARKIPGLA